MSTFLDAALKYRDAGLHPIPCEVGGKRPLVSWKDWQTAQPSEEQIRHWWTQWPLANIGLVLGRGLFAVDIDSFEGREALERAGVILPADAPTVTTGKGAHVYLRGDTGDRVGLVPGVDIRGVGYVVAPPSIHPSGRVYQWATPFATPPAAPPALVAMLSSKAALPAAGNTGNWVNEALAGVGEGGRDATCTRLAGYFLGKGVPAETVEVLLQTWAGRCTPPFPPDQVTKCVASIAAREEDVAPGSLPPSAADLMDATMKLIMEPVRNVRATGLQGLDTMLEGGLEAGTVTLLGGRPGTGKTALMLQIATAVARAGTGVLFVTLEMGATRLLRRVMSQVSQVKFQNLKNGDLTPGELALLNVAQLQVRALPLWIETRVRTVEALDAVLDEYEPGQVGLVVVDYLQKLGSPRAHDEGRQRVEHVSTMLSKTAVARDLPLLVASSLTRPDRAAKDWRPSLTNLRESGALESDADNVILLYREEGGDVMETHLAKQRDGATAKGLLFFGGETLTFRETA